MLSVVVAMRFFFYSLILIVCLVGAFIVPISAMIEHWSWTRWIVLAFAIAFPLAVWGDIRREKSRKVAP